MEPRSNMRSQHWQKLGSARERRGGVAKQRHPIPMKGGDEYDYLTRWRRYLHKRAGTVRKVKRGYWRRVRRIFKRSTDDE